MNEADFAASKRRWIEEYYEVLRDTYHKDCLACHQEPAKAAEDAGGLDWKSFYVKEQPLLEETWPEGRIVCGGRRNSSYNSRSPDICIRRVAFRMLQLVASKIRSLSQNARTASFYSGDQTLGGSDL